MPDTGRTGLEYAQAQVGGEPRSPFARLLGFHVESVEFGVAVVSVEPGPDHLNVGGTIHGGFLSALMDYAAGLAIMSTLPPGNRGVHAQATYAFRRTVVPGRPLTCTATCERTPKTVGHIHCEVRDTEDRLVATGTSANAVVPFPR